ncbi:MAG: hypothetical protein OXB95_00850, partial [Rhodobacteraceae bacterium]|nr:hypothetical protein [Paracoccaceae bacterium]
GDEYIAQKKWKNARLKKCPKHPEGGCGFARHGAYRRKHNGDNALMNYLYRIGFGFRRTVPMPSGRLRLTSSCSFVAPSSAPVSPHRQRSASAGAVKALGSGR